jgi:hypothetical protein
MVLKTIFKIKRGKNINIKIMKGTMKKEKEGPGVGYSHINQDPIYCDLPN